MGRLGIVALIRTLARIRPSTAGSVAMSTENLLNFYGAQSSLLPNTSQPWNPADLSLDPLFSRSSSQLGLSSDTLDFDSQSFAEGSRTPFSYASGVFTVGSTGQIGIDYLFDGGAYEGELAIFSVKGLEQFDFGTPALIQEIARRALSDSLLGYVVVSDVIEGARFSGSFSWEGNFNRGDYLGVKTFYMRPYDQFGVMLVPNGTVQQVFDDPTSEGSIRPLFSLTPANPETAFHIGQIADLTGDGSTFVWEDLRTDGCSDQDFNDLVFQIRGAVGEAPLLDGVIDPLRDWRQTDMGRALIEYAKPYINLPTGTLLTGSVVDIEPEVPILIEVDGVITPVTPNVPTQPTTSNPLPHTSNFVGSIILPSSVNTVDHGFPVANQPIIGVIDTGFSSDNSDLDYSRITIGQDRTGNDTNSFLQPDEGSQHGTHVLGIIGATRNNGIGINGLNDIAPLWIGRAIGSGRWAESLVEFVDAAKASGQPNAIVNLSFDLTQRNPDGTVTTRYEFTPQEKAALEYARQNRVLIVVAAGNDGDGMSILGQASQEFDNIITVGTSDGISRSSYSGFGYGLDLLAPGGTTDNPVISLTDDGLGTMAGTSISAARVTGAASLVWAANPELSYQQVINLLKSTATDVGIPGWDAETGSGILNIPAAVALAKVTPAEPRVEQPSIAIPVSWSGEGQVIPLERAVQITPATFSGTVISRGVNSLVRSGPGRNFAIVGSRPPGAVVNFDAWTRGEFIAYPELGTADDRWYRIAGTQDQWISGALIAGAPPTSPIVEPPPAQGYYSDLRSFTRDQWNTFTSDNTRFDVGWPDFRDERNLTPASIRQIYTDLSNTIFGRRVPMTAGYLLDPGYRQGIGIWHSGVDMAAPRGTQVRAVVGGTIVRGIQEINGNRFIGVRGDDGKLWIYGHLDGVAVPGGRIEAGQVIGTIGSLNHLHLEVQTGPYYRNSQSANINVVSNATLNPIQSYWELRNRTFTGSLPPTQPSGRREYVIRAGDTLWGVAQTYLGNGNRWREITRADGSTFTDAEARILQIGQSIYLPIISNAPINPFNPSPTPTVLKPNPIPIPSQTPSVPGVDDVRNLSTTLRFEVDNASLYNTQGAGFGFDFDGQFTVKPEAVWNLPLGMELVLQSFFNAGIYGFASAGTVDLGLSGDFQISRVTTFTTGQTTLSVNTAALNPVNSYLSTYLGIGAGINIEAGVNASLKNIPLYGDLSLEISNGFDLTAEELIAQIFAPGVAGLGSVDLGLNLNTNLWNDNRLEADDNAGLELNITQLLKRFRGQKISDFLNLSVELGIKQESTALLAGFRFDPDSIDNNGNDFVVELGQSGMVILPFAPEALRIRPEITLTTSFYASANGSIEVGVGQITEDAFGDYVTGQVFGGIPPSINLSREVNIPLPFPSISTNPFANSNYWTSISLA